MWYEYRARSETMFKETLYQEVLTSVVYIGVTRADLTTKTALMIVIFLPLKSLLALNRAVSKGYLMALNMALYRMSALPQVCL